MEGYNPVTDSFDNNYTASGDYSNIDYSNSNYSTTSTGYNAYDASGTAGYSDQAYDPTTAAYSTNRYGTGDYNSDYNNYTDPSAMYQALQQLQKSSSHGYQDKDYRSGTYHKRPRDEHDDRYYKDDYVKGTFAEKIDNIHSTSKEPTKGIMLRGLKTTTTAEMIMDALKPFGAVIDVRLIKNKVTGESRGFAFVDFSTVQEAQGFVEYQNGIFTIDGRNVTLDYSTSGVPAPGAGGAVAAAAAVDKSAQFKDWICPQCQGTNFARRAACFLCQTAKPTNPTPAPHSAEEVPTPSLIVRGLDPYTIEESIRYAFSSYAPVKDVRLMRDKNTGTSRCFAFVEFHSIEDCSRVLREGGNVRIDNHTVRMGYARPQESGSKTNSFAQQALWTQQWSSLYDHQAEDSKGPPAGFTLDPNTGYYYNATTGYYYDERTRKHIYYDETSSQFMYFDRLANKYLAYNPPKPVASPSDTDTATSSTSAPIDTTNTIPSTAPTPIIAKAPVISATPQPSAPKETPQPAAPVVPAGPVKLSLGGAKESKINKKAVPTIFQKKISKEMERWNQKGKELKEAAATEAAAKVEKEKEREREKTLRLSSVNSTPVGQVPPTEEPIIPPNEIAAATMNAIQTTNTPIVHHAPSKPAEQAAPPPATGQVICLLCKRAFGSPEALQKHETLSDLHKFNLEQQKQRQAQQAQWAKENPPDEDSMSYYGRGRPPPPSKKQETPAAGLDESNIGFQMLKNSGWKEGTGLGKGGSGITAPVEVTMRAERAGLGSEDDAKYAVMPGDSYQAATRKKALSRFEQISGVDVGELESSHPFLQKSTKKSRFS